MTEENQSTQEAPIAGIGTMVFGKWDATDVTCSDPGLAPYINLTTIGTPHSGGRHANSWFGKAKLSVVERFINNLMRSGQFSGKKQHCAKALESALDVISERKEENPLQVFIDAIIESAPCEETTRIKMGAVSAPKAVDSSPSRRLDIALRNLGIGCASATAKSKKTLTEGIVSELTKAASGDVGSYAVGKRDEVERIASSAR
ncbi:MAG: 30S ribosomal protein S7 [Euryarchaeota archaeon]|nr:30S ribosomal protein S7 [Euryarchaeota archaeon]|tara:strand:+ start:36165 stop:36773 length:609 start_codon:yes stop_codon:yes gene_type:complete